MCPSQKLSLFLYWINAFTHKFINQWSELGHDTEFQCNIFKKTHISANRLWIQLKWKHWSFKKKNCSEQNSGIQFSNCQSWFSNPQHILNFIFKLRMENSNASMGRAESRRAQCVSWTDDDDDDNDDDGREVEMGVWSAPLQFWQVTPWWQSPKSGNLDSYLKSPIYKY